MVTDDQLVSEVAKYMVRKRAARISGSEFRHIYEAMGYEDRERFLKYIKAPEGKAFFRARLREEMKRQGVTPAVERKRVIEIIGREPRVFVEDPEIMRLHEKGVPATEIAARLNLAEGLVRYRLRRAGYEPIHAPRFIKAEERRTDIARLHQEGLSPKEIAERLGVDWSHVHRRLQEEKLKPHPSSEELENTARALDEIVRLGKEDVPRYEIAKRTGSTWPLVSEILERANVRPVAPACGEIASWASTLFPLIDEVRRAHPNAEPFLRKVDELEKKLTAIREAVRTAQDKLPWRGNEERWCLGNIHYLTGDSLKLADALRGCIRALDVAELPKHVEQAEECVTNISERIGDAISQAKKAVPIKEVTFG